MSGWCQHRLLWRVSCDSPVLAHCPEVGTVSIPGLQVRKQAGAGSGCAAQPAELNVKVHGVGGGTWAEPCARAIPSPALRGADSQHSQAQTQTHKSYTLHVSHAHARVSVFPALYSDT